MGYESLTTVQVVAAWVLPILFAVTVHEVAHGYVAYLLGDKTASILGRLTLNPIKHIDVVGTIVVPIVLLLFSRGGIVLGWAKPVPINYRNLNNPRSDVAMIAAAGPLANFVMLIIWAGIAKIAMQFTSYCPEVVAVYTMGIAGVSINLMLMVLNLLPIPQLDGGHIIASILPRFIAIQYERLTPYGFVILLVLLALGVVDVVMRPIVSFLLTLIGNVFGLSL